MPDVVYDKLLEALPLCPTCVRKIKHKKNRGLRKCYKKKMISDCLNDRGHDSRRWPALGDARKVLRRMGISTSSVTEIT